MNKFLTEQKVDFETIEKVIFIIENNRAKQTEIKTGISKFIRFSFCGIEKL